MVGSLLPLSIEDAVVSKRGKTLIGPITERFESDGVSVVMGPNGAGKTTLLRLMHGLERPREGSVRWNLDQVTARSAQAFIFQTPILMRRTVLDNIAYPLRLRGTSRASSRDVALEWADKVGLGGRTGLDAQVLSAGERQKMAIARALVTGPQVLFLDEPTANLDGQSKREIEAILKEVMDGGTKIVLATHDIGQARRLGTDVLFLHKGKVLERGNAQDFFAGPKTDEARAFLRGDIVE